MQIFIVQVFVQLQIMTYPSTAPGKPEPPIFSHKSTVAIMDAIISHFDFAQEHRPEETQPGFCPRLGGDVMIVMEWLHKKSLLLSRYCCVSSSGPKAGELWQHQGSLTVSNLLQQGLEMN